MQRARNLRASLEPFVAAAFTATIVRLPAFPAARPMTCHACCDVSLYVCESCVPQEPPLTSLSTEGGRWTLLDILLDAPESQVATGGAEGAQRARVAWPPHAGTAGMAVLVATWSASGVGERRALVTRRLPWTLQVLGSRVGRSEDRWRECRELFTCVLVK